MLYQTFRRYYCGSADLTIGELNVYFPQFFANYSLVVTSLDSDSNLTGFARWLRENRREWNVRLIGSSVFIPAEHTREFLVEPNMLSHFDEIYCVQRVPSENAAATDVFTSDRCDFSTEVPQSFLDTFDRLGAVQYVSDGCGLNFACETIEGVEAISEAEKQISLRPRPGLRSTS